MLIELPPRRPLALQVCAALVAVGLCAAFVFAGREPDKMTHYHQSAADQRLEAMLAMARSAPSSGQSDRTQRPPPPPSPLPPPPPPPKLPPPATLAASATEFEFIVEVPMTAEVLTIGTQQDKAPAPALAEPAAQTPGDDDDDDDDDDEKGDGGEEGEDDGEDEDEEEGEEGSGPFDTAEEETAEEEPFSCAESCEYAGYGCGARAGVDSGASTFCTRCEPVERFRSGDSAINPACTEANKYDVALAREARDAAARAPVCC
jgi:hypothetical protein